MHHRHFASTFVAVLTGLAIGYVAALAVTSILLSVVADLHPIIEFVIGYVVWVIVGIAVMVIVRRTMRGAAGAGAEVADRSRSPATESSDGDGMQENRNTDTEEHA